MRMSRVLQTNTNNQTWWLCPVSCNVFHYIWITLNEPERKIFFFENFYTNYKINPGYIYTLNICKHNSHILWQLLHKVWSIYKLLVFVVFHLVFMYSYYACFLVGCRHQLRKMLVNFRRLTLLWYANAFFYIYLIFFHQL